LRIPEDHYVATNQQRRVTERRLLQQQLEDRRVREARRKRVVLISSIVGTLVVIAAVVIAIVAAGSGGSDSKKAPAAAAGKSVSFEGVTVANPTNLAKQPGVTSTAKTDPTKLEYKDLVVGKGKAASPTASVTVQYTGVLYKNGKQFDASWKNGQPATFSLKQVVPGFTQGIGGKSGVPPMKVGGRRIMILPASLGYGGQANNGIPANSSLVFVVDLTKIG
jgi:peptidylprolyl isomerase